MRQKEKPAGQGGFSEETAAGAVSACDITPAGIGFATLLPEHAAELASSGISAEVAALHGVYSATQCAELPEWAHWLDAKFGAAIYPVLCYPMTEAAGSVTGQVKPAPGSVVDGDGSEMKYVSPAGALSPQLPVVRQVDAPEGVLIVEGVKQSLAVATYAPDDWVIYRICGITGWVRDGVPTKYLRAVRDLDVVIIPDADAATKRGVYDGAVALGEACEARRAKSVRFVRVAGYGSTGIDDVLGGATDDDERRELVEDLLAGAADRPAKAVPKGLTAAQRKAKEEQRAAARLARERQTDPRPVVHVGEDRFQVIHQVDALLHRWFDGLVLFRHGDLLGQIVLEQRGPVVTRVSQGAFADLVSQVAITVEGSARDDERGTCTHLHAWPDKNTLAAVESRFRSYAPLEGVSSVPLVREDGSIVSAPGYDPETRHYIHLAEGLDGLTVPEHPTAAEIEAARVLLVDELLGDFLLKEQSDVAHAVAALLTPLVRPLLPTSPAFVINGLQAGVGKGLLLHVISTVVTGTDPSLSMLPGNEDEMRKSLTASLHAGATSLIFDEVAEMDSAVLNGFITAERWSDRRLGVSERIEMPNRTVTYFAGNGVLIVGDTSRRAVQSRLHTNTPNPESRSGFRHSDLKAWVAENRCALLQACLTLIRAWFDAGQPVPEHEVRMGSFERWQDMIAGIFQVAGIDGLLDGWREQRDSADFEGRQWAAHLDWLRDKYGDEEFTARRAAEDLSYGEDPEWPPGLEDLAEKPSAAQGLGKAWSKQADRWRPNDLRIVTSGPGQGGRNKWKIEKLEDDPAGSAGSAAPATPPSGTPPAPARVASMPVEPGRPMPTVTDIDAGVA